MLSFENIPKKLPITCLTQEILFPGSSMKISMTTFPNMNLVNDYLVKNVNNCNSKVIIGVFPCDGTDHKTTRNNIGCAALVLQLLATSWPKQSYTLYVVGVQRIKIEQILSEEPYVMAAVTALTDNKALESKTEINNNSEEFRKYADIFINSLDWINPLLGKMKKIVKIVPDSELVDTCAAVLPCTYQEKLEILNASDVNTRIKKIIPLLKEPIPGLVDKKSQIFQRRGFSSLRLIHSRLLTDNLTTDVEEGDDLLDIFEKLKKANLPPHAHKIVFREFQRLKKMTTFNPEYGVLRSYIELISELPWSTSSEESIDILKSKQDLDSDHYGMEKVKKRVLEYLAVRQLKNTLRGPILCFVGPPGVGKTSIGHSIAKTLGREFHRISLGGVCNESDIRGHRRTYIGAFPGRIIQSLKVVGVNNPVILLDEVDKMAKGSQGDPRAALLEVLDPEQNCHFVDHYLNIPFNLSQVTFIATANTLKTIPPALMDRMEIIHVPGYTQEEKFFIARRHLVPKQMKQHGLDETLMEVPDEIIHLIIRSYTREAGVRNLERKLAALCRSVAVQVAGALKKNEGTHLPISITTEALEDTLGPIIYEDEELWCRVGVPGVAVGLAATSSGGEIMLIEASRILGGSGELILTGHLGEVMKESATLALNWVRTVANKYEILNGEDLMNEADVHIHFPAAAVGKEGPSAGVAIATALISLFTGIPICSDVAMTGEITLRGVVLPVGGIKQKVLAAYRAGLSRVIIPKKCKKDLLEISQNILAELKIVMVEDMNQVFEAAFNGELFPIKHLGTGLSSKL